MQKYCSYGDFFQSFCDRWIIKEKTCTTLTSGVKRTFYLLRNSGYDKPYHGINEENPKLTEILKTCDGRDNLDKKWTKISEEPDIDTGKYYRLLQFSKLLTYLKQRTLDTWNGMR